MFLKLFLGEVLLCPVKVKNAVRQTKEVDELRQAGLSSFYAGDVRLELVQGRLNTTPPLVDQGVELR